MTGSGPVTVVPSADGVGVAVHDLGGPADPHAPVLVFAHAAGLHGLVWEPVAAHLVARYRCLALDLRGHGRSGLPPGVAFNWPDLGDDVVAVLESELLGPGIAVHGVGHSMGGAALALAAARRPGTVRSLWLFEPVIVPPGALGPPGAPNVMAESAARRRVSFPSHDEAAANFAGKPPLNELHPRALRAYVEGGFAVQEDGTVTLRCLPSTEAAAYRTPATNGAWDALSALDLPVAVVVGRAMDWGPAAFVGPVVAALPQGTLIERRRLGHFGPLEDPEGMARDIGAWVAAH